MLSNRCWLWTGAVVLLIAGPFSAGAYADQSVDPPVDSQTAHIRKLIDLLGNDSYATREKAQAELARLGLAAFDELLDAQEHDDVEVALRARYLIRGMNVGWVREDDPPEIKAILRGYEAADAEQRRSILDRLAMEDDHLGAEALCRLARFETNELLSKKAALLVMLQDAPRGEEELARHAGTVRRAIGKSDRTGPNWLRTYLETLAGKEAALAELDRLTRAEQETYSLRPDRSSPAIMGDLLLWQAGVLRDHGRKDEAFDVIVRRLDLLDDGRTEVMETLDWMIHRQAWSLVDEVDKRFAPRMPDDAEFVYRLAEARIKQGREDVAQALAERAFEHSDDDAGERKRLGVVLQTRGMFQWAQREFRQAMEQAPPGTIAHVEAYLYLSEMLHDQQDDMAAAAVLQELIDLAEKDGDDNAIKQQIVRRRGGLGPVLSRMHFFYAEGFGSSDETKKQIEHLAAAVEADSEDADVLIALYRAPTDDELSRKTRTLIRETAAEFQKQVELYSGHIEQPQQEEVRQYAIVRLASLYNQYAWLIGNTEGDYDTALRYSHRSLELRPGTAGYLDTLGRCYYAKGDYESAVKYQTQAVRRDPHSGLIRRQLELFERALAKQQASETVETAN